MVNIPGVLITASKVVKQQEPKEVQHLMRFRTYMGPDHIMPCSSLKGLALTLSEMGNTGGF